MAQSKKARLVGGAGTGKTTDLKNTIHDVVAKLECSPEQIGFASFTKAARAEMVERVSESFDIHPSLLSNSGWFRTVHSTCLRQVGVKGDCLLTGDDKSMQWTADQLRVEVRRRVVEDSGYATYVGDTEAAAAMSLWDVSRNRVVPLSEVHAERSRSGLDVPAMSTVRHYVEKYENAKRMHGKFDFVDIVAKFAGVRFGLAGPEMIEPEGEVPPGVLAWIFDEYQDSSRLVDLACRRLADGPDVRYAYLAADPFQSVFGFGGADFRNFLAWEVDKERTMPQSWRCPKPIMDLGERCLKRMKEGYFDRKIAPAGHNGQVIREPSIERALQGVDSSRTTLVLARCNYSLEKYASILEQRKIPFARINAKDDTVNLTAYNAFWSLEHGMGISGEDWKAAVSLTPVKGIGEEVYLSRGVKAAWKAGKHDHIDFVHPSELQAIGCTHDLIQRIQAGDWAPLIPKATPWYMAARRFGAEQATRPNVRLSTIHGAKGMEAQDVVLATETAYRIENERELDARTHDEECRIEYVGVTRAKERLIVCESDESYAMNLPLRGN